VGGNMKEKTHNAVEQNIEYPTLNNEFRSSDSSWLFTSLFDIPCSVFIIQI